MTVRPCPRTCDASLLAAGALAIAVVCLPSASQAQVAAPVERSNYTSLDAGRDAYYQREALRMSQINRQIDLNQQMRWRWTGISSFYPGAFEAWPMIPGDIWGYPLPYPIRQSVGQRSYQAGPNRWISEPVYADDPTPRDPSPAIGQPAAGFPLVGPRPAPLERSVRQVAPPPAIGPGDWHGAREF